MYIRERTYVVRICTYPLRYTLRLCPVNIGGTGTTLIADSTLAKPLIAWYSKFLFLWYA